MNDAPCQPSERELPGPTVAQAEDSTAVEGFGEVESRRGLLVRLAYRFCWNVDDAEDAVQSALSLAMQRRSQLADRGRLWVWVRSIVIRQCFEIRRTEQRKRKLAKAIETESGKRHSAPAAAPADASELAEVLRSVIPALPEKQQTAIVLRHLENMDYAAIGEVMGISESTARVHVRNGKESLRRLIAARYPEWARSQGT